MDDESLQQLALQQQSNQDNPWTNQQNSAADPNVLSPNAPTYNSQQAGGGGILGRNEAVPRDKQGVIDKAFSSQDNLFNNPLNSAPNPNAPMNPNTPATAPGSPEYVDEEPTKQIAPGAIGPPRPYQPVLKASSPAGQGGGGGGGGPAPPSALKTSTDEEANVDEKRALNLQDQAKNIDEQRRILVDGKDTSTQLSTIAEQMKQADDASSKIDHFQFESQTKQRFADLASENEQLRQEKIDPQHWFKDRGVAGSILAAISIGAGAFAAGMPHSGLSGQNFAMQIIDKSIDRDINAQKDNIDNKWKALNFKGTQAEREYTRNQYALNQKDEIRVKDYDHSKYLVNQAIANTNDKVAINGLNKLSLDLDSKNSDLLSKGVQARYTLHRTEEMQRAAAASAAQSARNDNPLNDKNIQKGWAAYADDQLRKKPEDRSGLSFDEYKKIKYGGQGLGSGTAAADDKVNAGLAGLKKVGDDAAQVSGFGTSILGSLTPGGTQDQDKVNQYNALGGNAIKLVEPKINVEDAERIFQKNYAIVPGLSQEQKAQRIKAFQNHIKVSKGLQDKAAPKSASEEDGK